MELSLLYIWILQGMWYLGVTKMWRIFGAHTRSAVSPTERMRRGVSEKRSVNEGEKNSVCSAELHWKRGNHGPDVGWQHHGIGLVQQELLIMKWDRGTKGSQHWAAWDGGISLLPPFVHEHLVQRREVERSKGNGRREMRKDRDMYMRKASQGALGNVS